MTVLLEPQPSRFLQIIGGVSHVWAGIAVFLASIPLWVKAALVVAIGLSLARFGYRYGNRHSSGFIRRLELLDERWRLEMGNGNHHHAQYIDGYAHPMLVLLNFRLENGRRQSLALLPDSADAEALRKLRVWLKTQRVDDESDHPW